MKTYKLRNKHGIIQNQKTKARLLKYFRFERRYTDENSLSLQDMLFQAFMEDNPSEAFSCCKNRLWETDDLTFINNFCTVPASNGERGHCFGELISFGKKNLPIAIDDKLFDPAVSVHKLEPPIGKHWAPTPLYFLVIENHVIVSTSLLLKERMLEEYLQWFLSSHTRVAPNMSRAALRWELDRGVLGNELENVQKIKIIDPLNVPSFHEPSLLSLPNKMNNSPMIEKSARGQLVSALFRLLGRELDVNEDYNNASATHDIAIDIGFSFERKAASADVSDFLRFIDVFRDVPDDMIEIHTKNSSVRNGKVRLQTLVHVKTNGATKIIDWKEMERAMLLYFHSLVTDGKIEP
ncbi:hypothetical protein HL658_29175 [Azospirillum sp. RWY-5-1]|uniref:Uncharacterized protein n=1 Tax=Azospirillum oleiclasticum TaxID=2735135 RepID=A0ABX2TLV9_9PROT|nr:hypothetical protein [Azospirillum oleiclasticum]NYZ16637.1 hypothetical protein [Azospirillum oleiclasticum]NYZ24124.1 hypothetical protein [Azospirillum oleiclasticum]